MLKPEARSPPYCDCRFPTSADIATFKGCFHELITCRCGEEDSTAIYWQWEPTMKNADCIVCGPDVTFHPIYSQGTAIVRGERPLAPKLIHFWEMRILTGMSGTDVMIGIGTNKVDLAAHQFHFVSALGLDEDSWGISYRGVKHHKGKQDIYGKVFAQGCIVGVYLDLTRGYLEFFLNRRSLGIAYTNIPIDSNVKLYPMISSTAAKSAIRLMNSTAQKDTLQFQAFRELAKIPKQLNELSTMPGLKSIVDSYWFLAMPSRYSHRSKDNEIDLEDEVVISLRKSRKLKYKDEETDINDLYSNAHKVTIREVVDSDDDEFVYYLL